MVSNVTVSNGYILSFKEGHNCRMKKYHFLNINPSNMIVLKFHMLFHKDISVQLWHASSNKQIQTSTVYEGCSICSRPKVEADVLRSCNLARVQIYSIDEYAASLNL